MTAADAAESSCRAEEYSEGELEVLILVGECDTPRFDHSYILDGISRERKGNMKCPLQIPKSGSRFARTTASEKDQITASGEF